MILTTYEKKNELESLTNSWKDKLSSSHAPFAKAEDIPPILAFLQTQNDWLYSEGENSTRGIYSERIEAVKQKI